MCGIIGCVGREDGTLDTLVDGLSKLEYRGYDSAGVAMTGERTDIDICKCTGQIEGLRDALDSRTLGGEVGIGHTRWSTHGPPTDANAHPHMDCTDRVAVVHNGIIENYQSMRDELTTAGHTFTSDTDTEVVAHLVEEEIADGRTPERAFREAVACLDGSYAVAAVIAGEAAIFAARNDSPLVLGIEPDSEGDHRSDGAIHLASDVPAFRDHTDRVVYLEDGEFARLDGTWTVTDSDGTPVEKTVDTVEWDPEETGKSGYDH